MPTDSRTRFVPSAVDAVTPGFVSEHVARGAAEEHARQAADLRRLLDPGRVEPRWGATEFVTVEDGVELLGLRVEREREAAARAISAVARDSGRAIDVAADLRKAGFDDARISATLRLGKHLRWRVREGLSPEPSDRYDLVKGGKALPEGTRRTHGGREVIKRGGKWVPTGKAVGGADEAPPKKGKGKATPPKKGKGKATPPKKGKGKAAPKGGKAAHPDVAAHFDRIKAKAAEHGIKVKGAPHGGHSPDHMTELESRVDKAIAAKKKAKGAGADAAGKPGGSDGPGSGRPAADPGPPPGRHPDDPGHHEVHALNQRIHDLEEDVDRLERDLKRQGGRQHYDRLLRDVRRDIAAARGDVRPSMVDWLANRIAGLVKFLTGGARQASGGEAMAKALTGGGSLALTPDGRLVVARADDLRKGGAPKPPPGFQPIPKSRHGGYRRQQGGKWIYWYPDRGTHDMAREHHAKHIERLDRQMGRTRDPSEVQKIDDLMGEHMAAAGDHPGQDVEVQYGREDDYDRVVRAMKAAFPGHRRPTLSRGQKGAKAHAAFGTKAQAEKLAEAAAKAGVKGKVVPTDPGRPTGVWKFEFAGDAVAPSSARSEKKAIKDLVPGDIVQVTRDHTNRAVGTRQDHTVFKGTKYRVTRPLTSWGAITVEEVRDRPPQGAWDKPYIFQMSPDRIEHVPGSGKPAAWKHSDRDVKAGIDTVFKEIEARPNTYQNGYDRAVEQLVSDAALDAAPDGAPADAVANLADAIGKRVKTQINATRSKPKPAPPGRKAAGTPTGTNAFAVFDALKKNGGVVPVRVPASSHRHIKRVLDAGGLELVEKDGKPSHFELTAKGAEILLSHGYDPSELPAPKKAAGGSGPGSDPQAPDGFERIPGDPHGVHMRNGRGKPWVPHGTDIDAASAYHAAEARKIEAAHRDRMTSSGYPKDKAAKAQLNLHWRAHYALKDGDFREGPKPKGVKETPKPAPPAPKPAPPGRKAGATHQANEHGHRDGLQPGQKLAIRGRHKDEHGAEHEHVEVLSGGKFKWKGQEFEGSHKLMTAIHGTRAHKTTVRRYFKLGGEKRRARMEKALSDLRGHFAPLGVLVHRTHDGEIAMTGDLAKAGLPSDLLDPDLPGRAVLDLSDAERVAAGVTR